MQPEQVGRYKILSRIGKGGMAEVFLASAPALDGGERVLALKRLLSPFNLDAQIISMMTDEARLSVWLTHPNIVQVLDFGKEDHSYCLALEFVGGCDLCDLIRVPDGGMGRPLPPGTALYVMSLVAEALDFAHNRRGPEGGTMGIIHRDVSPHNVLLSTEGEIKLTDFGLARATISCHYSTADVIRGKFSYMPKEQAMGWDIDQRIDIFGAGVTLYEALTGVKPYTSNTLAEQIYQLEQPVPPPSALVANLPEEVDHICLRAMAPEPEHRYATARQLASELQRAMARFTSAGREAEHLSDLVTDFIGPEESAQFRGMHHMNQDEFPIVDGGVISAELDAVRQASGLSDDPPLQDEAAAYLESGLNQGFDDDEGDTLTEEDDLDIPTLESPALPLGGGQYSPPPFEDPDDLLATREVNSMGVMAGAGVGSSGDDLDTQATVLAPEDGPKYARQALGLEEPPSRSRRPYHEEDDDGQATIQRSPSEMVAAFDRALKKREETRYAGKRSRRRRRAMLIGVTMAGLVLFGGGFFIGWLMQQIPEGVVPSSGPDARVVVTPRAAPIPAPVPLKVAVDAAAPAPEGETRPSPPARVAHKPRAARPPRNKVSPRAPTPRPPKAAAPARAPRPAPAAGQGFLSVNTDSAARVYIGDRPKALSAPLKKLPLDPGIHRIRVFFEQSKSFSDTQWVSIKPRQTFTLYFSSPAQE